MSAATVIQTAYRTLRAHGYSTVAAAGVIGNSYQESGFDPAAEGDGGGGLWGFTANPQSLADLKAYAAKAGKPWTNVELQTKFLVEHVPASIVAGLNRQSTPQAAAAYFMSAWEKPLAATENQAKREEGARIAYSAIKGGGEGGHKYLEVFGIKQYGLGLPGEKALDKLLGIELAPGGAGAAAGETVKEVTGAASKATSGLLGGAGGELVLKGVLLLAGAVLVIYGIMVAVRPPDRALSVPKMPVVLPV